MLTSILVTMLLFILTWTIFNSLFLKSLPTNTYHTDVPTVTILVPLRNEERNVVPLLTNFSKLTYPYLRFVLLDDESTDQTNQLLHSNSHLLGHSKVIKGTSLPTNWVGKVHACYQLSQHAESEYLLFLDADIRLQPDAIERSLALLESEQAGMLTGFPRFPTNTWLSKLLVPLQHVIILLHLPLAIANKTTRPAFSAAHGAFMLFKKEAYEKIGGHLAVKDSLVEDIHLAKAMKRADEKVCLANITDAVSCYMYETNKEVWNGFAKNIFPGLGRSLALAIAVSIFYCFLFIFPLPLALIGLITDHITWTLPLLLVWIIRLYIDWKTKQDPFLWLLMPVAALALLVTLSYSIFIGLSGKGFEWKGRRYL